MYVTRKSLGHWLSNVYQFSSQSFQRFYSKFGVTDRQTHIYEWSHEDSLFPFEVVTLKMFKVNDDRQLAFLHHPFFIHNLKCNNKFPLNYYQKKSSSGQYGTLRSNSPECSRTTIHSNVWDVKNTSFVRFYPGQDYSCEIKSSLRVRCLNGISMFSTSFRFHF